MKFAPSTLFSRKTARASGNTANTVVTVNASADETWVIDQIIYSVDRDTITADDVHLNVDNETDGEVILRAGINLAGLNSINFPEPGLVIGKNKKFHVYISDEGTVTENHVVVIYR